MNPEEYQKLAMRTEADQRKILTRLWSLGPDAMRLDNAARGLSDECGEVSSAVKKFIEYGQPLDRENLLEEVGDCLWRLAQVCEAAGFTLSEAMEGNIAKLDARYPEKYTDVRAAESGRDRKKEAEAVRGSSVVVQDGHGFGHVEVCGAPSLEEEASFREQPSYVCTVCNGSGYKTLPERFEPGVRCPRGCRVNCPICSDPNCDNPGGKH